MSETTWVEGTFVTNGKDAVLIQFNGENTWIPKSIIADVSDDINWEDWVDGDSIEVEIPKWFAEEEGLVCVKYI